MARPNFVCLLLAAVGGGVVALSLAAALGHVLPAAEAAAPAVPGVVRAQRFELVDAAGKLRAGLEVRGAGSAGLVLYDARGTGRAWLLVADDGTPSLDLRDAAGKLRAGLEVYGDDGSAGLTLTDAVGTGRAWLAVGADGAPVLKLLGATGPPAVEPRAPEHVTFDYDRTIEYDVDVDDVLAFAAEQDAAYGLRRRDEKQALAMLGAGAGGTPALVLYDTEGRTLAELP